MDTVGVIGSYENCLKEKEVLNQEIKKLFAIKAFLDDGRGQTVCLIENLHDIKRGTLRFISIFFFIYKLIGS